MILFIDTTAFFALLDQDDVHHRKAKAQWVDLLASENVFVTTNYILVECFALIQHRLGMEAVRAFQDDILPLVRVEWVDAETHKSGVSAFFAASRRKLSLVDCVSFETMRCLGIKAAFTFDPHFSEQGFSSIS